MEFRKSAASIAAAAMAISLISGCATGAKGSARRQCYDAGLQPGTPAFSNCWQGIARSDTGAVLDGLVGAAVVAGALSVASNAGGAAGAVANRTYTLTAEWFGSSTDRMCRYANGTVLNMGLRSCPSAVAGK